MRTYRGVYHHASRAFEKMAGAIAVAASDAAQHRFATKVIAVVLAGTLSLPAEAYTSQPKPTYTSSMQACGLGKDAALGLWHVLEEIGFHIAIIVVAERIKDTVDQIRRLLAKPGEPPSAEEVCRLLRTVLDDLRQENGLSPAKKRYLLLLIEHAAATCQRFVSEDRSMTLVPKK